MLQFITHKLRDFVIFTKVNGPVRSNRQIGLLLSLCGKISCINKGLIRRFSKIKNKNKNKTKTREKVANNQTNKMNKIKKKIKNRSNKIYNKTKKKVHNKIIQRTTNKESNQINR